MQALELGRAPEGYTATIEPYRSLIQTEIRRGFKTLLLHDFKHFDLRFRGAFPDTDVARFLEESNLDEIRKGLPEVIRNTDFNQLTPGVPDPEWSEHTQLRINQGMTIGPYFGAYALTLLDSISYILAVGNDDRDEEEKALFALAQRKVPLAPVCPNHDARLLVDGKETNDPTYTLNGIRFIAFYNMLHNAHQHGIREDENVTGSPVSTVELNSSPGSFKISNFSLERVPEHIVSDESFYTLHYGLFLAQMYADIAGLKLEVSATDAGTYVYPDYIVNKNESPRYLIQASLT